VVEHTYSTVADGRSAV